MMRRSLIPAFCTASESVEKASGAMSISPAASAVIIGGVPWKRITSSV